MKTERGGNRAKLDGETEMANTTKRIVARLTFLTEDDALKAATKLHQVGYLTNIMPADLLEDPQETATFMEAAVNVEFGTDMIKRTHEVLDEVSKIVDAHGGFCADAGPVPDDHIPHQYNTPHWRGSAQNYQR
jgi:hypothetical protein